MKSEEDHYRFDTEKLLYEPLYEIMDLNPMVENFVYYSSGGAAGTDVALDAGYFSAFLENTMVKNGFVLTVLEFEIMNGQMQEMKRMTEELIALIDEEIES